MGLSVSLDRGRTACRDSIDGFLAAVAPLTEHDLLGASRCHGWTRLDVVVHVLAGWQEMLGGLVSPVEDEPTVDAASYWPAFAEQYPTDDPVPTLMSQRRRTATYARPAAATAELLDVAAAVRRGVVACADRPLLWQGHVFAPGDYLAVWAVEDVVHQLDLLAEPPAPVSALALARSTIEALVGRPLPAGWDDQEAVLVGTGRSPVPDGSPDLAGVLPALG